MTQPPVPPERAVMEDLDPEAGPPARQWLRREWLLGVLVVLGVLGVAGWDWWRQEQQETAYAAGQRAQAAQQWEAAWAAFTRAGDFQDAPERAQDAATTIAERDRQYVAAQDALRRHDPLRVLAALRAVDQLQSDYRDTPRLLEQVTPEVYRAALNGTVTLRPKADPPGLYTYQPAGRGAPGGWLWLPNSNRSSRVRVGDETGTVIYDGTAGQDATGRTLWQVTLGSGPLRARRLAGDPAAIREVRVGPGGVWTIGEEGDWLFADVQVQGYSPLRVTHQAPGSDQATPLSWPPRRFVVMSLDRNSSRYILADLSAALGDDARTMLHVADSGDDTLYPLYKAQGLVLHARFSPDSRYVLLLTSRDDGNDVETYGLILIDRQADNRARVLQARSINRLIPPDRDLSRPLDATFLTRGPRAGQVVILTQDGKTSVLSIVDPRDPLAAPRVLWTQPAAPGFKIGVLESAQDAGLSLLWMDRSDTDVAFRSIYIDAADHALLLTAPGEQVFLAWAQADHLFAVSAPLNADRGPEAGLRLHVRSLPWSTLRAAINQAAREGRPVSVNLAQAPPLYKIAPPAEIPILPLSLGPGTVTGAEEGDLYVRSYDGTVDLLLEPDVAWIYAPGKLIDPVAYHELP